MIIMALDSPDGVELGLHVLNSNFCFPENSTEIFGDPLEGTSVWIWNNTGLVKRTNDFFFLVQTLALISCVPVNRGQTKNKSSWFTMR